MSQFVYGLLICPKKLYQYYCLIISLAAHELEDNSNHVVVLPCSINIVKIHIM